MTKLSKTLIAFCTAWGPKFGGINSFNFDLLRGFSAYFYRDTQVICIALNASEEEIRSARDDGIHLISLDDSSSKDFLPTFEADVWEKIQLICSEFNSEKMVWLGHDRITGAIALAAAKKRGGRSALIHHMSYGLYEAFAENSALAKQKENEQKDLFEGADVVLAVGPLLRDALADLMSKEIKMLVPGLADIAATANAPIGFKAFLSGRLSEDARKIKQAHLGVASFAKAIYLASNDSGLPNCLQSEKQPKLTLRGVDFENHTSVHIHDAEADLNHFAEEYAGCVFPLHGLPFTTNRKDLFDDLRKASVAMMPSWHDGFGLVAWEAIAAGVPLIVSKTCGVHQLLTEFENGNHQSLYTSVSVKGQNDPPFFRPEDQDELTKAIVKISKNPAEYKEKAIRLRDKLLDVFTWAKCATDLSNALGWESSTNLPKQTIPIEQTAASLTLTVELEANFLTLPTPKWRSESGLSDSQLLRAEEAIIPFEANREPFLLEQIVWANDSSFPIKVRLLTGAGGVGKTRLALEMCDRLKKDQWQVGFLSDHLTSAKTIDIARQIGNRERDCFVVLDYAETRQPVILALLKALLVQPSKYAVRVLLLARDGGDWWEQLQSKDPACEALLGGYASTGPYGLPALHQSESDRQAAYQNALQVFAEFLRMDAPVHTPNLKDAHFSHPLYIQMSALIAVRGERPESAEALTRAVVNHERRYWRDAVFTDLPNHMSESEYERQAALLMTLATMAGGIATPRDIESVWLEAGGDRASLKPLFRLLAPLYPDKQGLQGLRPDLIGEALVAQALLGHDGVEILDAMLGQKEQDWRYNTLTVLARLLRHRDTLAKIIETSLHGNFLNCVNEIIKVCIETPSVLPYIVESAFIRLPSSKKSQAAGLFSPHLEYEVLPFLRLACLVSEFLVEVKDKQRQKKKSVETEYEYACELGNYSNRLSSDGSNIEALEASKEAVDIFKKLTNVKSERFEPDFARSLSNYANRLSEQGQIDQALAYAKQALDIRQKLADAKPERFEPDLAMSLSNYANRLSEQGQIDQALAYAKQALDIRQKLADAKPERFESDLATSLYNYAISLSEQGQIDQALVYAKRALDIRQKLADAMPERFEPDLAASLSNYANSLFEHGQIDQSLVYAEQALDIRQKLADAKPERFGSDFAMSLSNYANSLSEQGLIDQASALAKQALDSYQKLTDAKPERFEPDLATALSNYANLLSGQGQIDQASALAKQALDIRQKLAEAKPERFEPDLAASLCNYANSLSDQGQIDQALVYAQQALDICQKLADAKPERFEPDLARVLSNYANLLSDQGQIDQVSALAKQALDIRQKLADAKPERFEPDLAASLCNYANSLSEQGQIDQALVYAEQALDIHQRLADAKPERFASDLAISLLNYANIFAALGQWNDALRYLTECIEIYSRPSIYRSERNLSNSEIARLHACLWKWLFKDCDMINSLVQTLPGFKNKRLQRDLDFFHSVLSVFANPSVHTIGDALNCWRELDTVQKLHSEAFYLLLAALASARFGMEIDANWRQTWDRYKEQRQGNIARWILEIALKLGFSLR